MQAFRLGADGIYRCQAFQEFVWQTHGFGTREASPSADVTLRQIHSDRVLNADGFGDREREGDALITNRIGKSIGVRTADCVPILLLDTRTRAVAAVHAGWRGTAAQVAARTVEQMGSEFGTSPGDLLAAIGPCIRRCCYEVGHEVAQRFGSACFEADAGSGKYKLNLPHANRAQLQIAGIDPDRIFDCDLCTTCDSARFYSYRREPDNRGRMIACIARLA